MTDPAGSATSVLEARPTHVAGPTSRLFAWAEASAWRSIAMAVVPALALATWAHAVLWWSGRLTAGTIDWNEIILVTYVAILLVAAIIGRRIARVGIRTFWPATGWPEAAQGPWLDRFMGMPHRHELVAVLVGLVIAVPATLNAPPAIVGLQAGRDASYLALFPTFAIGYVLTTLGILLGSRWLALVAEIHREARAIDPFEREPIYAFSKLTVYVGLVILVTVYYTLTLNSAFVNGNMPALVLMPFATILGIAAFVAPLWGIHGRLVREKAVLLGEVDRRMRAVGAELYENIDAGRLEPNTMISATIAGLRALRDQIRELPTWPWPPQLLRGFVSALLLPVIVYVLSRLAAGFVSV
jgi:hypothetical protein